MVESEKAAGNRRRFRVPTSVVATLLGAALTVLLAPAFTRQWDDRQAARELKVGLAEDGVISAFQTIQDGARLAEGDGAYDVILGSWGATALRTELRAKAYFGSTVDEWQKVDQDIQYFLVVSQDIADIRAAAAHRPADERFQYRRDQISSWLNLGWTPHPGRRAGGAYPGRIGCGCVSAGGRQSERPRRGHEAGQDMDDREDRDWRPTRCSRLIRAGSARPEAIFWTSCSRRLPLADARAAQTHDEVDSAAAVPPGRGDGPLHRGHATLTSSSSGSGRACTTTSVRVGRVSAT